MKRVCYDKSQQYMVIDLNGTYYHYCEIDAVTVSELLAAPSLGTYYNARIPLPPLQARHNVHRLSNSVLPHRANGIL